MTIIWSRNEGILLEKVADCSAGNENIDFYEKARKMASALLGTAAGPSNEK